jgi:hypothetical protein
VPGGAPAPLGRDPAIRSRSSASPISCSHGLVVSVKAPRQTFSASRNSLAALASAVAARAEEAFARRHGTLIVVAHRISSALRADLVGKWHHDPPASLPLGSAAALF